MSTRFDDEVELAWSRFEVRLKHALTEIDTGSFSIDVPGETEETGAPPYVQFAGDGHLVRAEVSSNEVLDAAHLLGAAQQASLEALGWHPPVEDDGPHWWCSVPNDATEILLPMVTAALRQVFSIVHPEFLLSDVLWPAQEDSPEVELDDEPPEQTSGTVCHPETYEELVAMVAAALGGTSHPAKRDSDGDFPFQSGKVPYWVRVHPDKPMLSVFGFVVTSVRDIRQAEIEVRRLNERLDYLRFILADGTITAKLDLLAVPFVPQLLRNTLDLVSEQLDDIAADTALRVNGRLWLADLELDHRHTDEDDPS